MFDDPSSKQGICQAIDFLCGTDSQTFPKEDKVREVNLGLDEAAAFIHSVDDRWQFDDLTLSTSIIGYFDFTINVQTISVDTSYLAVRGIYLNTGNEQYVKLDEATEQEIFETKYNEYGTPTKARLIGNKIYFNKIPSATTTGNVSTKLGYAVKVHFERNIVYFDVTATTAIVPYNPQFTSLATLYAARKYAMGKSKENLPNILREILKLENLITSNYGRRSKTQNRRAKPMAQNNK